MENYGRCCHASVAINSAVPHFLLCEALQHFEDGWASFRVMATCRQARDSAAQVATSLRTARQTLLDMMAYLQGQRPRLPGFLVEDKLDIAMLRLLIWDPPVHARILFRPITFMEDAFAFGARGGMQRWIDHYPQYRGLDPLGVLRVMNPSHQSCESFKPSLLCCNKQMLASSTRPLSTGTTCPWRNNCHQALDLSLPCATRASP